MSNEALDKRIAREFMGWSVYYRSPSGEAVEYVDSIGRITWAEQGLFKPTVDMNSAYVVLEKIASKFTSVNIFPAAPERKFEGWVVWVPSVEDANLHLYADTLPLAISKLAEAIMDSPEHMELFT